MPIGDYDVWQGFLIWWTVAAVLDGWQAAWVVVIVASLCLHLAFTAIALALSRRVRKRLACAGLLLGALHWGLSLGAVAVCAYGVAQEVLPKPDVKFATRLGGVALFFRSAMLLGTALWVRQARQYKRQVRAHA